MSTRLSLMPKSPVRLSSPRHFQNLPRSAEGAGGGEGASGCPAVRVLALAGCEDRRARLAPFPRWEQGPPIGHSFLSHCSQRGLERPADTAGFLLASFRQASSQMKVWALPWVLMATVLGRGAGHICGLLLSSPLARGPCQGTGLYHWGAGPRGSLSRPARISAALSSSASALPHRLCPRAATINFQGG